METVGVIGAGAWGTALAHAYTPPPQVTSGLEAKPRKTISHTHNPTTGGRPLKPGYIHLFYAMLLPKCPFVVPTQSLRDVCQAAAPLRPGTPLFCAAKA